MAQLLPQAEVSGLAPLSEAAREAYHVLASSTGEQRNEALRGAAREIRADKAGILASNAKDMAAATALSEALRDRLRLDEARVEAMARGLEEVAELPDPLARESEAWERPNGLEMARVPVPLGVIGVIYESRPNVTADAAGLCVKSGNAVILRGGSESFHSSQAIVAAVQRGVKKAGLPEAAVQMVPGTDRRFVGEMLTAVGMIDVIIPRGGASLTARVQSESRVPTLLHLDGNCHTYVHEAADKAMAKEILLNAKLRRTGVCGATESLLVDRAVLAWLPELLAGLKEKGCEIRGDAEVCRVDGSVRPAVEADWGTEYLDAVISVKTVADVEQAIAHINRYGSHHTDAVITSDEAVARRFLQGVDSAIVMHNASTQFADGGEFGMGAEIGIATGRLHARGPVGAAQLTTYKYVVKGRGQIRP